ncbi:protein kinase activating protein dpb11 [Rhodotorula kratochvilovae]
MPHPSQFNRGAGGKKGPRQVTSKRQPKITLRPAPARDTAPVEEDEFDFGDDADDEPEEPAYGYREALRGERLPLQGLRVSVSGCDGRKEDLLHLVQVYGGERHGGLQEDTTHLVTDSPRGKKYDVALARRMHVMKPSWLFAVRDAWISGEDADFAQIELAHAMLPLAGVNACLTGFAKGEYKENLKTLLTSNGATITVKLDSKVTHLLVASPSSPHSQTPTSDKLLHARKNRHRLHAEFVAVWEGWAREAVKYGGIRPDRTYVWEHKQDGDEPQEDVSWEVDVAPSRCRSTRTRARSPVAAAFAPRAGSSDPAGPAGRSLVPVAGTYQPRPAFKGYDTSLLDGLDGADPSAGDQPAAAFDLAHGKVLKKRRRVLAADSASQLLPSASQAAPPHAHDDSQALLEAFGASQHPAGEASRFADADTTGLPSVAELLAARARQVEEPVGEMALQLIPGEVEMQLVRKGKSVIKALSSSRQDSFVHDARGDRPRGLAAAAAARRDGVEPVAEDAGIVDDSAFFDSASLQGAERKAITDGTSEESSSSPSSDETVYLPIFEGKTFALMELKSPRIKAFKRVLVKCAGKYIDNAQGEELDNADYVIVDHVDDDPRIRTVCWIELCIFYDTLLEPADRLLERPITYACPVPGLDGIRIHFSGFGPEEDPVMHHFKRFCAAVGMIYSAYMDRTTTHLVVNALEEDPSLRPEDLDGAQFPKVAKAREWGLTVCSLRELRNVVQERADEVEREKENAAGGEGMRRGTSAKGKAREVREITNEVEGVEESMQGPLSDCVVFFSTKVDVERQRLASTVQDLGGVAARQYSESVTHYIYSGVKASEPFKEFKLARADGAQIVHPRWIEECGRTQSHVSEKDFPHTFNAKKGGQLFDAGMSMHAMTSSPRASPGAMSRETSREGALARSPSKLSLGAAAGSPRRSPSAGPSRRSSRSAQPEMQGVLEEAGDAPPSPSPSPARRRRSDTTATEIAETADLGGFDGHGQTSPQPLQVEHSAATSSPRPALPRYEPSQADVSSDSFELPPLRSETRPPPGPAADESSKSMLRQQTSLLLAQLSEAGPQVDKPSRTRSRTALGRGKSSGTISLANSKDPSPLALPSDASTSAAIAARRIPGQAYALDPSQATQDESLCVVYDNVAEAAAREQIRRALAGGEPEAETPGWQDPIGARTRRARAAKR